MAVANKQLTSWAALGWGKGEKIVFEEEEKSLDEQGVMKGCQERNKGKPLGCQTQEKSLPGLTPLQRAVNSIPLS